MNWIEPAHLAPGSKVFLSDYNDPYHNKVGTVVGPSALGSNKTIVKYDIGWGKDRANYMHYHNARLFTLNQEEEAKLLRDRGWPGARAAHAWLAIIATWLRACIRKL